MKLSTLGWRHFGFAATLLAVCVTVTVASQGCATTALRSWGSDEVNLYGAGSANTGGHSDFSVLLSVKSVVGVADGTYELRQPESWKTTARRTGADGIDEVTPGVPLVLERWPNSSGQWGQWDIKVAAVPPERVRNPVSSFFTRTTGDGSVPGEFPRLGVSIVHDSNRDYSVVLWGEDLKANRWICIGVAPVGRGSRSSLRRIAAMILLPSALAIDMSLVPFALTVLVFGVYLCTKRSGPLTLAVIGLLFLACYPLNAVSTWREENDIRRALSPLATATLDALRDDNGRELQLTIPGDAQWHRINRRLGRPSFLVVPVTPEGARNSQTYSANQIGLSLRVTRNGSVVEAVPTSDTPYGYSSDAVNNGLKFTASESDRVTVWARVTTSNLPPNARLIVTGNWGNLATWDWVDGAAMTNGFMEILAFIAAVIGLVLTGAAGGLWLRRWHSHADANDRP